MHQTIATVLKTVMFSQPPQTCFQAALLLDYALVTVTHALCSMVSTKLEATHGGPVFSQDMCLNIPLLTDWHTILASCMTRAIGQ